MCGYFIEPAVRGNAFRTEFLPDPVTVDCDPLSGYVSADVFRCYRIALPNEEGKPSVPYR